jgi:hypothetical protein
MKQISILNLLTPTPDWSYVYDFVTSAPPGIHKKKQRSKEEARAAFDI